MRRGIAFAASVALGVVLASALAGAATVRVGTLVLHADGEFTPRALPKSAYAPISFRGHSDIETTDGSVPPALQHVKLEFDHDGRLTTSGLPVCPPARIESSSPAQARRLCRGALVGSGRAAAVVDVPGGQRVRVSSPLSLFNGPRQGGDPTVVGHAQIDFPATETYVVVVPIERRSGTYGYRASFDVPEIAQGHGSLVHVDGELGRRYRFRGRPRSYVSARCSDFILQTQGRFDFADGTVVYGSAFKVCSQR
jgi:hypothetical protein